jgi:hypothetical protein
MLFWIVIPVFALPLIAMIFLLVRRGSLLSALAESPEAASSKMLDSLGIDPTRPVQLEFTLSFPTREAAAAAAADFPAPQWSTTVGTEAGDDGWPCIASTNSVVNHAILDALMTLCKEVASAQGGSFDGWQVQSSE